MTGLEDIKKEPLKIRRLGKNLFEDFMSLNTKGGQNNAKLGRVLNGKSFIDMYNHSYVVVSFYLFFRGRGF